MVIRLRSLSIFTKPPIFPFITGRLKISFGKLTSKMVFTKPPLWFPYQIRTEIKDPLLKKCI